MSKVILEFQNIANYVVDSPLEITCVVDFMKTDCQFMLQPIKNIFYGALPRMVRRAEDQTVTVRMNEMTHDVVFVCGQIVAQKGTLIGIGNILDDML